MPFGSMWFVCISLVQRFIWHTWHADTFGQFDSAAPALCDSCASRGDTAELFFDRSQLHPRGMSEAHAKGLCYTLGKKAVVKSVKSIVTSPFARPKGLRPSFYIARATLVRTRVQKGILFPKIADFHCRRCSQTRSLCQLPWAGAMPSNCRHLQSCVGCQMEFKHMGAYFHFSGGSSNGLHLG